jgi:hypothetical protein
MKLVLDNNIFFEFVPFDDKNFDHEGNIVKNPETKMIHEIEEKKEYALLMSTNAGAWRYLIGDTLKFVSLEHSEVLITGRTKHYLSLAGEHLSVDNMNRAIQLASDELNISIPEFTVAGIPYGNFFAHQWYIACNDNCETEKLKLKIDQHLRQLNDDYATERDSALKEIFLEKLPEEKFLNFMKLKGKVGSQHKFPRVLKGKMLDDWNNYLETEKK